MVPSPLDAPARQGFLEGKVESKAVVRHGSDPHVLLDQGGTPKSWLSVVAVMSGTPKSWLSAVAVMSTRSKKRCGIFDSVLRCIARSPEPEDTAVR